MVKSYFTSLVMTYKRLITVFTLVSLLSACGFHLRGDYLLNDELQTLYVSSSDIHGELTRLVKQHLSHNQVKVLKHKNTQVPELRIMSDTLDRRTLSVFENGQVAEYELIYAVHYQLRFANEEPKSFHFELNRDYQDDPSLALAKSRELSLLLSEMRTSAADKILRDMARVQR
ncbi:LPS assembly lipoprotein LptE [Candidatus Colwellia aromaticivorans]|uniref:LPS-assembly lipoprotein LptE n=1 Tax=Candidatus Colwellia aromaticivorans TaxID=2267621 RepID=UPI001FEC449C|nr:LPS assembly lipoprotein LptE [Candidatus Colwellia aromaticivorans]